MTTRSRLGLHEIAPDTGRADDWRSAAACLGVDPELWFPIGTGPDAIRQAEAATAVCRRCPVVATCAEYALTNRIREGIWGGLTEEAREAIWRGSASDARRDRRQAQRAVGHIPDTLAAAHGTEAGYQAHDRYADPACDPCKAAHATTQRERRRERYATARVDQTAVDRCAAGDVILTTFRERVEVIRRLAAKGWPDNRIAALIGRSARQVARIRTKRGITSTWVPTGPRRADA